jgi:broad specificity phosphatase PhoE
MTALYLVRHGQPVVDRTRPAHEWALDPATAADVRALRPRLPAEGAWYSSPEPKALGTARLLTDGHVEIVPDLREHRRDSTDWVEDFEAVVRRAFERPDEAAYDGWEPLARCRDRVVRAAEEVLSSNPGREVVLVGHGTAWTLLASELSRCEPDLDRWAALGMPDVWVVPAALPSS